LSAGDTPEKGATPNHLQFSVFPIATTNRRILRPTHFMAQLKFRSQM